MSQMDYNSEYIQQKLMEKIDHSYFRNFVQSFIFN